MELRQGLKTQRMRALRTGALAIGIFLLVMIPWRLSGAPGLGPVPALVLHAGVWAVIVLAYGLVIHRLRKRIQNLEAVAFGLMLIGLGITGSQLYLYGRLQETAGTLLVSVISGGVLQRRRSLAAFQAILVVVWLLLATHAAGWGAMGTWLFDIVLAGILAFCLQHLFSRVLSALLMSLERQRRTVKELREALDQVRTLSGLIPICAHCKKVRNDGGYWEQVESYIQAHSEAEFTHGICPDCTEAVRRELKDLRGEPNP